jgi:hypothetical protein
MNNQVTVKNIATIAYLKDRFTCYGKVTIVTRNKVHFPLPREYSQENGTFSKDFMTTYWLSEGSFRCRKISAKSIIPTIRQYNIFINAQKGWRNVDGQALRQLKF